MGQIDRKMSKMSKFLSFYINFSEFSIEIGKLDKTSFEKPQMIKLGPKHFFRITRLFYGRKFPQYDPNKKN